MTKKLYIKTYGCQMNVYDSVRMADVMAPLGYTSTNSADDADLVILNTCHIREKAEEKVYSDLGRLRRTRKEKEAAGKSMLIAVGGCVGQAEGDVIMKRAPYVDMVFGPQSYHNLPEMVARAANGERNILDLDFAPEPKFDALPDQSTSKGPSAFLSVQEGCDQFCTFCVVPYTRGAEFSRPAEAVLTEARKLAAHGTMEITLLGQNVNAYHGMGADGKEWGLGRLIRSLAEISGIARIRYMTSHPLDMTDDLIAAHGEVPQLMPFLHLPVQSGSDAILKKMNRKHNAAYYINVIEKLRAARSDMAFSSDFIIGFPGETDLDFAATLKLIETVGYAQTYSFKYSPRPGTPAAIDDQQIPEEVKTERLIAAQALISRQQLSYNRASVGKTMPVLFDREGKFEGQLLGKSPYMQSVVMDRSAESVGKIVDVVITAGYQNSLAATLFNYHSREGGNLTKEAS